MREWVQRMCSATYYLHLGTWFSSSGFRQRGYTSILHHIYVDSAKRTNEHSGRCSSSERYRFEPGRLTGPRTHALCNIKESVGVMRRTMKVLQQTNNGAVLHAFQRAQQQAAALLHVQHVQHKNRPNCAAACCEVPVCKHTLRWC